MWSGIFQKKQSTNNSGWDNNAKFQAFIKDEIQTAMNNIAHITSTYNKQDKINSIFKQTVDDVYATDSEADITTQSIIKSLGEIKNPIELDELLTKYEKIEGDAKNILLKKRNKKLLQELIIINLTIRLLRYIQKNNILASLISSQSLQSFVQNIMIKNQLIINQLISQTLIQNQNNLRSALIIISPKIFIENTLKPQNFSQSEKSPETKKELKLPETSNKINKSITEENLLPNNYKVISSINILESSILNKPLISEQNTTKNYQQIVQSQINTSNINPSVKNNNQLEEISSERQKPVNIANNIKHGPSCSCCGHKAKITEIVKSHNHSHKNHSDSHDHKNIHSHNNHKHTPGCSCCGKAATAAEIHNSHKHIHIHQ